MMRIHIQLPEEDYEGLREVASRQRRSIADCIREGIRLFLHRVRSSEADFDEIAGKFHPLPMGDLKPHDRTLTEAIRESKTAEEDT